MPPRRADRVWIPKNLFAPSWSRRPEREALADHTAFFVLGLTASDGLLPDVHEVAVDAGPASKGGHDAVGFPSPVSRGVLQELFPLEGLLVQKVTILHGDFAVQIWAHFVGQLGHGEERLEHLIQAAVLLGGDLKIGTLFRVLAQQLVDLSGFNLPVEVPVTFVPADDQRNLNVLLGLVFEARLGLQDLLLQTLDFLEGVPVVQAEDKDKNISCKRRSRKGEG